MLVRANKKIALWVISLVASVILLPLASLAATSPTVTTLSPLAKGLRSPVKAALDAEGNIYVADQLIRGVVKYNTYGIQQLVIPSADAPNGLAIAQDGSVLVSQESSVVRYSSVTGQEIGRLTGGNLLRPAGIAVDDVTGYAYVADALANQVVVYTASGDYVKSFAQGVSADASGATVANPLGKLSMPTGITFEKVSRQLAVADTLSNRVQFFDVEGNFVKSIGNPVASSNGTAVTVGMMQFALPMAVAFEYSKGSDPVVLNRMYVVDSLQGNIQVIDPATSLALLVTGTTKNYIGSAGMLNGQLMNPSDAVFDAVNNRLLVVNGLGNVTIYGIDGGKNPVDLVPPEFSINPVPAVVTTATITISGTAEAGASVTVLSAAPVIAGTVKNTSATTWECVITGLVSGNNTLTVTAGDSAGNISPAQSVTIDYLSQLPAPALSVSSAVTGLTNMPELLLSGTVDEGSAVSVTNKNTSVQGFATVNGNNWTYRVALEEGGNIISVTAQKTNSAIAETGLNITLDSLPPTLEVSALSNGSYTSTQVQNISGKASDSNMVTVLVNDVPVTLDPDGVFSVPASLVTGVNVITVEARDLAGNVSLNTRNLIYDETKPQITIINPVDNSFTNNAVLQISGNISEMASIIVAGQSVSIDNNNNWFAPVNLVDGLNTIEVVATDLAGNTSALKRTITLDSTTPALAVSSPVQDIALNKSSIDMAGTVGDDNDLSLTYSLNGQSIPVAVNAGQFSFKVDFTAEGVYPVTVTATDLAGNATTVTRSLIYDVTPPVLVLDAVKWQARTIGGKMSGTVDPGSTVTVKEGSTVIGRVTVDGNKWSADLSGISYNQAKLSIVAIDAAGNTTTKIFKTTEN